MRKQWLHTCFGIIDFGWSKRLQRIVIHFARDWASPNVQPNKPCRKCFRSDIYIQPRIDFSWMHNPIHFKPYTNLTAKYCFPKADYENIRIELESLDTEQLFNDKNNNQMVEAFYRVLFEIINRNVHQTTPKVNNIQQKTIKSTEYQKPRIQKTSIQATK